MSCRVVECSNSAERATLKVYEWTHSPGERMRAVRPCASDAILRTIATLLQEQLNWTLSPYTNSEAKENYTVDLADQCWLAQSRLNKSRVSARRCYQCNFFVAETPWNVISAVAILAVVNLLGQSWKWQNDFWLMISLFCRKHQHHRIIRNISNGGHNEIRSWMVIIKIMLRCIQFRLRTFRSVFYCRHWESSVYKLGMFCLVLYNIFQERWSMRNDYDETTNAVLP